MAFEGCTFEEFEPILPDRGINIVHVPEHTTVERFAEIEEALTTAVSQIDNGAESVWLILPVGVGLQALDEETLRDYGWVRA